MNDRGEPNQHTATDRGEPACTASEKAVEYDNGDQPKTYSTSGKTLVTWYRNGDHPDDYKETIIGLEAGEVRTFSQDHARQNDWEGQVVRRYRRPDVTGTATCPDCGHTYDQHGWIDATNMKVCPGDYVVTTPNGAHYALRSDVAKALFP